MADLGEHVRRYSMLGAPPAASGVASFIPRRHVRAYMFIGGAGVGYAMIGTLAGAGGAMTQGIIGALGVAVLYFLATFDTGAGTIAGRLLRAGQWATRGLRGTRRYVPWSWEAYQAHVDGSRRLSSSDFAAMRYRPDAAEGFVWLDAETNKPGIAWQAPRGQEPYYSAVFEVSGRITGLEPDDLVDAGAEAFGRYLAGFGGGLALPNYVQGITRVLPPDLAWHERWVVENLEPDSPEGLHESYEDVLGVAGAGALVQRHFVVVRWPESPELARRARTYAKGVEGVRELLRSEVAVQRRLLDTAGVGVTQVLSARQTTALMRHLQDPTLPVDKVRGLDPEAVGLASRDRRRASITEGEAGEWWHATAVARADNLAVVPRSSLWVLPLLTHMREPIVRTISVHMRVVDAAEAIERAKAQIRAVNVEVQTAANKNRVLDPELLMAREYAERMQLTVSGGSQQQGLEWCAFVTVSARSADELTAAKRAVEEAAEVGMGWSRLSWCDGNHSGAMATTWPLARGLSDPAASSASRARRRLGRVAVDGGKD